MSSFSEFIKTFELRNNRLKGKFLPISENIRKKRHNYKVKAIYSLEDELRDRFYLIKFINPENKPKYLYFISFILAYQSSDLLVFIARDLVKRANILLTQYPLKVKQFRLSLICLKEIKNKDDFFKTKTIMKELYKELKHKLIKISEMTD